MDDAKTLVVERTADIAAAFLGHNTVPVTEVGSLISAIGVSLTALATGATVEPEVDLVPAVSIRTSVKPDHVTCLECGTKCKMLKRHLGTAHDLTPDEYRDRWKLPASYPMVAATYADKRRELAKKIGLGRGVHARGRRKAA